MDNAFLNALMAGYEWKLSAITLVAVLTLPWVLGKIVRLVPVFGDAAKVNADTYGKKMENPRYAANQAWNRKWGTIFMAVIYGLVMPFVLTVEPQPWWRVLVDCFVILMVYDFFYYLVHRFLFHDGGWFKGGGPLMWVHAVHHRQHNPCRMDSSYIHPIEVAMGLGLYVACIFVLSRFMGDFHVVTIVFTWIAFSEINLHNHDLWKVDRFPFKYLNTMAFMHHNHHARFTGGNFATISLLYDWMFGTLDYGEGYKGAEYKRKDKPAASDEAARV